jgi:hypothetical protein
METNNEYIKKNCMNKLAIRKVDKGKTLLIITQKEYQHKMKNFTQENHLI